MLTTGDLHEFLLGLVHARHGTRPAFEGRSVPLKMSFLRTRAGWTHWMILVALCVYIYIHIYGGFHKWGVPTNGLLIMENPTKMDDLGPYPYSRKPPYIIYIYIYLYIIYIYICIIVVWCCIGVQMGVYTCMYIYIYHWRNGMWSFLPSSEKFRDTLHGSGSSAYCPERLPSGKDTKKHGKSPCLMGKSPCLMGKSPFLMGKSPCLMGKSPFLMGKSPCLMGKSPCLMGKSPCLMGKSTINGQLSIANCAFVQRG